MELDPRVLRQIRSLGGDELLSQLLRTFLEVAPARLERLRAALREADAAAVEHSIHSIRSSSASLGAVAMAEAAGRLERLARARDLDGIQELGPVCEARFSELVVAIEERLEDLAG